LLFQIHNLYRYSKITRLQADLSRAADKNKQLRDQMERARAAQAVAEVGGAVQLESSYDP
jgi:hypothetical protein